MSEWQEVKLGELVDIGSSKRVFYEDYVNSGIPFYRSKEVIEKHNGNDISTELFITKEKFEQVKAKYGVPQAGDLLLTSVGTLGIPYIVEEGEEFYFKDGNLTWFKNYKSNLYNEFLYYWIISPIGKNAIDMMSIGSTQAALTIQGLKNLDFDVPPIEEQKAIASVLSSLDDKIDLLHRENSTLERMAETLFRQWFVEEAKEDWEEGKLVDVSENIRQSVQTKDIQATTKYIGLEHIDRRKIALKQYGVGEDVSSNKYAFEKNDILFGKLRPYFHKVCFSPFSGICSTDILVIRPKSPDYFAFCLFAYFQNDVVEYANLGSGGTRMPRTDWETLKQYPISLPDKNTLLKFNALVLPSINKITGNLAQIQTLEKLRDNLLPKLMSGEIRINND